MTYARPSADLPPLLERADAPRGRQLGAAVAALVVVAAVLALIFYPTTNDRYIRDLKNNGMLVQYPNHQAAITAGKDFCANLEGGAQAQGTPVQLVAVRHYCPVYASGFELVPAGVIVAAPKNVATPEHHKVAKKKA